jgi:biopolymer transport protein ExbD
VRQDEIRILVSAEGRAQLEGVELSPEELPRALARALAVDPNRPVRVLPVPDSSLQAIVTLLAELERADVTEVALQLASQPPRVE